MNEQDFLNQSLAGFRGYSNLPINNLVLNESLVREKCFIEDGDTTNGTISGDKVAVIRSQDLPTSLIAMDAAILLRAEESGTTVRSG